MRTNSPDDTSHVVWATSSGVFFLKKKLLVVLLILTTIIYSFLNESI